MLEMHVGAGHRQQTVICDCDMLRAGGAAHQRHRPFYCDVAAKRPRLVHGGRVE